MRILFLSLFIIAIPAFLSAQTAARFALPSGCSSDDYLPGHVIVKFLPEVSERTSNQQFASVLDDLKAESCLQKFPNSPVPEKKQNEYGMTLVDLSGVYEISFNPDESIEYLVNRLMSTGLFEYAYPHYIEKSLYVPDDPNITSQYYLTNIRAYQAWDICKGDTNHVIGITDTGYEFNHPDLSGAVKYNYDDPIDNIDNDNDGFTDNFMGWDLGSWDNNPQYGFSGHGIHVSGLAGATADNGFGMAGISFCAKILPVKIDNAYGNLVSSYDGIIYAADHGADIINCSWGSTYSATNYGQDIINYATFNCGALVVAAAGNANNMNLYYPASYDYVLSVAGTDAGDYKYSNSSYGYKVDICAPGTGIYSTWGGASFTTSGGTSMSSPIVAGAAALVSSYFPQLNMLQVAERLRNTADIIDTISLNIPYEGLLGKGRLNMYRALTDTMTPSVRMTQWSITDSADVEFDPGDTLYINMTALNYLDTSSSALYAKLECLTPEVEVLDSVWNIGQMNTLQSVNNFSSPFRVRLLNVAPSTNIKFLVHFYDGSWNSFDYLNASVNKDYSTLDTNLLALTVTSHGNFAFNNIVSMSQGDGFRYNGGSNLVSGFGLVCGTDMFHISDNLYSIIDPVDSDFVADNFVLNLDPAPFGDQCLYSQYTDAGADSASRMHVLVRQWTYAWDTPEDNNFILVKYQFIDDSTSALYSFYAGLFADWDIVNSAENRCWYDPLLDAIIATHLDSTLYIATTLLSDYPAKFYAADLDGFVGSIALTDGFSESEKFSMMSTNRFYAGTDLGGNDISAMVSTGPHLIAAFDTLELTFAIVAGVTLDEIAAGISRAKVRFNDPQLSINSGSRTFARVFPNPADEKLYFSSGGGMEKFHVSICDMTGKSVYQAFQSSAEGVVDVSSWPAGIYLIRFSDENGNQSLTFTISR